MTTLLNGIQELRTAGMPIAIARVDECGRHQHLTTISGHEFSLHWVKQNFGGGRFAANGVEFLIEGPSRFSHGF
jgi:hypothetical protein